MTVGNWEITGTKTDALSTFGELNVHQDARPPLQTMKTKEDPPEHRSKTPPTRTLRKLMTIRNTVSIGKTSNASSSILVKTNRALVERTLRKRPQNPKVCEPR